MSLLTISGVTLRMGGRTLLEGADLSVDAGRRIGLVGRNGAGKSTLLKAIAGDLAVDGGDIRLASRARMAQLRQTAPSGPQSLLDAVLEGDQERLSLLAEAEAAEHGHVPPERVAAVWERLGAIDALSAPARAATILAGLGFDAEAQGRALDEFSGGWRMRVALATVLFSAPDLLLLDEPTNHLDLEATMWLEGWLARFAGAALVVSHDQGLLNRSVQYIAHLDQRRLNLTPGGYDEFVRIRTEQAMQQAKSAVKIEAQRAHMQAFVDRFRASASKARQAQSRLRALEKLPVIDSVIEDAVTRFAFPEPRTLPPPILSLNGVSVGYGEAPVLERLGMNFEMGDRIALLGANGNGKSTFAKLLAGRLEPQAGALRRPGKLRVGYFAQHQEAELDARGTALDHIARALPLAPATVHRGQLARFGLDRDRALTPTGSLSGGERARLLLALATRDAPQLLILDEPTNHLDIDACDALVRALSEFAGAVLLITHDPHLVELVADTLWIVEGGTIAPYEGDMEDYRALLLKKSKPARQASGPNRKDERRAARWRGRVREGRGDKGSMLPISIVLDTASNVRDLGGWPTVDGRRVRTGLVFRAPALAQLSFNDQAAISALGLRSVCDLRGVRERAATPVEIDGAEVLPLSIEPSIGAGLRDILRTGQMTGHVTPAEMLDLLADAYRAYALQSCAQYRAIFARILSPDGLPLLLHCSAGKDRTGFGSALLLRALGVEWEYVVADYLATNTLWRRELTGNFDLPADVKDVLLSAHEPLLAGAFAAIDATYGSLDAYLIEAIGMDAERHGRLRALLLT